MKIDKSGKITIPKDIRDKYNLTPGMEVNFVDYDGNIYLKPVLVCWKCKKALPKELENRGACLECPPKVRKIVQIY